jgi:NAD(P)H-hydrate epimerase
VVGIYTAAQVRELDRMAIEDKGVPGITLMRRAAEACVDALIRRWPDPGQVAVLCGSGNNAGDGYIIAGLLSNRGIPVRVAMVGRPPADGTDAATAFEFSRECRVEQVTVDDALRDASLIVDALLGTGLAGEVRPEFARVIEQVNRAGTPVLSVDIPSGLCADTGSLLGSAVHADVTVTFIARKLGLFTNDGPEYRGQLEFASLDVPDDIYNEVPAEGELLDYLRLAAGLTRRHRNAHKVSHGQLLIIGGDHGMPGAVSMAAEAALHAGAGMVTVATRGEHVNAIVARRPEVMAKGVEGSEDLRELMKRASAIVLGPGLGRSEWSRSLFQAVMELDPAVPMVVDADGLNLLAEHPCHRDDWILTPHPGEAGRLLDDAVQADRITAVKQLQSRYGGVCLLKGAGTLIASSSDSSNTPKGKLSLCPYGNPGMSVAGMGDLLAGTVGGLVAQQLGLQLACELGAVVHSLAADNLVQQQGERGLLATELLPEIRRLINLK